MREWLRRYQQLIQKTSNVKGNYGEDIEEGTETELQEGLNKGANDGAPENTSLDFAREALVALTSQDKT